MDLQVSNILFTIASRIREPLTSTSVASQIPWTIRDEKFYLICLSTLLIVSVGFSIVQRNTGTVFVFLSAISQVWFQVYPDHSSCFFFPECVLFFLLSVTLLGNALRTFYHLRFLVLHLPQLEHRHLFILIVHERAETPFFACFCSISKLKWLWGDV